MSITDLRTAVTTAGGTPTRFAQVPLYRELVSAMGGTPQSYTVPNLLRELIVLKGGTPTRWDYVGLLRQLVTQLGGTPATHYPDALEAQVAALAVSAPAFNPLSVSPTIWIDPSDLSSMFQDIASTIPAAVDSPVARANDKSGNGNNLLIATGAARPILRSGGGLYWLDFDGVDDTMVVSFAALAQPIHRMSALRLDTWASNRYIFDGDTADSLILRQQSGGVSPELAQYAGVTGASNAAATLGAAHVVSEYYSGASSYLRVDATQVATSPGGQGCAGLTVGLRPGGAVPCPVKVFGIILCAGDRTAQQLTDTRAYLAAKGGL